MILVLNCGSSSIKFQLINPDTQQRALSGLISEVGSERARIAWQQGDERHSEDRPGLTYREGILRLLALTEGVVGSLDRLSGVGHRVVHGGEAFTASTLITPEVVAAIEACVPLAPLHNPANLLGIQICQEALPATPQVAVFDTAFHQTMPPEAYLYAIPLELYERHRIRRYGFHGTSHRYVSQRAAELLAARDGEAPRGHFITLHLGNGCSATAIRGGQSVDTSLGMTPLEGLVMGTRCGDLDPSLPGILAKQEGLTLVEVDALLNKKSGLLGLAGSSDMRLLVERYEAGDAAARRALAIFARRIRKYVGAFLVELGEVEALIFTGGIGENAALVRALVCEGLAPLGIVLDQEANAAGARPYIHQPESRIAIMVIPTNEELMIALDTAQLVRG